MRLIIFGAGAIGGVIGARAHEAGHDVTLVARGPHFAAIRDHGLKLETPDETVTLPIPAVERADQLELRGGELVVLAVKSQHTPEALTALSRLGVPDLRIACAQNGIANEPAALRFFGQVQGMVVQLPAVCLDPGVVQAYSSPVTGILDVGRYPRGVDDTTRELTAALSGATFDSLPREDIMGWKRGKLLSNLTNAIEAICDSAAARRGPVADLAQSEAGACFEAAGVEVEKEPAGSTRPALVTSRPIGSHRRPGASVWQSLSRGAGSVEVDYLNGEIVRLGREHGVPTPVNALLQGLVTRMVSEGRAPGWLAEDELLHLAQTAP